MWSRGGVAAEATPWAFFKVTGERVPSGDIWAQPENKTKLTGPGFLFREMHKRGIRVYSDTYPVFSWKLQGNHGSEEEEWTDEWEDLAGTLVDAIKGSSWLFEWGILGKCTKHDWLECNACGEVQLCDKKSGAPSQNKKCNMTLACKGAVKRFDEGVFEFIQPGKKKPRVINSAGRPKIPEDIRMEALALAKQYENMTKAAKVMNERHPQHKFSAAGISGWRKLYPS